MTAGLTQSQWMGRAIMGGSTPGRAGIHPVGDWQKQVSDGLRRALANAVDVLGYTGEKACRQALYFMAESAAKMTKRAPARRPVTDNPKFRHLLRKDQYKVARMKGNRMSDYYRFTADKLMQPPKSLRVLYANSKPPIGKIGKSRGLASRSWMWGLKPSGRPPITGVTDLYTIYGGKQAGPMMSGPQGIVAGYVLENRLNYIMEAMPAGWEQMVETLATNRIMGHVKSVIEGELARAAMRGSGAAVVNPSKYFRRVA